MKLLRLGLVVAGGVVALGLLFTWEAPVTLVFGWILFLVRVLPRVTVDWPSIAVGVAAAVLFAVVAAYALVGRQGRPWKLRWSLALVAAVVLLFTAGLSMIALVHQTAWLLRDDRPLFVESLEKSLWGGSQNQLREFGRGFHTNADVYGSFPPGGTFTPQGEMLHSWETHLLPWIGYDARGIDFKRPWNASGNAGHFRTLVPEFINPGFRAPALTDPGGFGLSHFAANSHVLAANKGMKLDEITDGLANTLLVGEVNARFQPWGHPVNWRDPGRGINRSPYGFGGPDGSTGAQFLMADGSVRFVGDKISQEVLRALSTPRGGEEVNPDAVGWGR